jgi:O-antigen ligase
MIFLPLLVLVLILAAMWHGPSWTGSISRSAALSACLALSLYTFVNATWSWDPVVGIAKASLLLSLILALVVVSAALGALNERQTSAFCTAFTVGAGCAIVYLLVEIATDSAITRGVYNAFPELRPEDTKRIDLAGSIVAKIKLNTLNQGVAIVMLNLWPALLMMSGKVNQRRIYAMVALILVGTAAVVFSSEHSSSQVALLGSVIVFALAWKWNRLVIRALAASWCLAFMLVLPASFLAHDAGLQTHPSVPFSFKARVVLWNDTAEKTLEHPWGGIGVNSMREVSEASWEALTPAQKEEHRARRRSGDATFDRLPAHHGHNLYLQTWYELGGIGAALLALAGALVILRAETMPRDIQPYAAAAFASFALIAAFAWGMWQAWWLCAIGLLALYLCLGRQRSVCPADSVR